MRIAALALLLFATVSMEAKAGSRPSCREAWQNTNSQYDFKESYEAYYKRLRRDSCEKDWAVLVYMAADNNLFPYALWDLFEMEAAYKSKDRAGSTPKADLLVQVDGTGPSDLRRLHIQSGPVEWSAKKKDDFEEGSLDQVKSPVVARLEEKNSESEKERLENFLLWALEAYPAKNHMVIVWGHGQGWKSYPVDEKAKTRLLERTELPKFPRSSPDKSFGGIAFRESSGGWLDIPALASVLDTFKAVKGKPVEVYASDACLMQMLEVSHELSPYARFLVGSAQVQSFLGLPYRRIMYELNTGHFNGLRKENRPGEDGKDEPYLLAKMLPTLMKQSLDPKRGLQGKHEKEAQEHMTSSSLTSVEMEKLLIPEIARVSAALKAYAEEDKARVLELKFVTQNVPTFEGGAQDFGVFLGYLDQLLQEEKAKSGGQSSRAMENLQAAVVKAKQALDRAVLAYAYGAAYGIDQKTMLMGYLPRAVSIWLPVSPKEYKLRKDEFAQSRLWKATRWGEWLELLFAR
jgi:hypothetical protein